MKDNEVRKMNIIFCKSGGNASKNAYTHRVSIPTAWLKQMGITKENRIVEMDFNGSEIRIKKSND